MDRQRARAERGTDGRASKADEQGTSCAGNVEESRQWESVIDAV